jgi:hypothetical protein
MSKKSLIGIIAIIALIVIIAVVLVSKPDENNNNNNEQNQTNGNQEEVTQESLDASIASTIEKLKTTCSDFLAGDISDASICPAFDSAMNQNICHYCFAVKNNDPSLCNKISDSAFNLICQKATSAQ